MRAAIVNHGEIQIDADALERLMLMRVNADRGIEHQVSDKHAAKKPRVSDGAGLVHAGEPCAYRCEAISYAGVMSAI
ncbi:hypothetical protein GCM10010909_19420 [Acidocella aquatica]|uniref:Uncharacterized protein n=1 Tax=Acidocella aquatica TaxID=1922313 RepID=A0ABQ6A8R1_9PROT|nr:hypothetical protein GCM10010909_19420 [Acidocella aquatica]